MKEYLMVKLQIKMDTMEKIHSNLDLLQIITGK